MLLFSRYEKSSIIFTALSSLLAVFSIVLIALNVPDLQHLRFPGLSKYVHIAFFLLCLSVPLAERLLEKKLSFWGFLPKVFLVFAPTVLVLSIGLYEYSKVVHFFLYLLVSAYFFGLYLFLLRRYVHFKRQDLSIQKPTASRLATFWKNNSLGAILTLFIVGLFLFFGTLDLGKSASVDEPLWTFNRIPKFWNNVADGEIHKTMISDKPGITVALVSGIALNFFNPDNYELVRQGSYSTSPQQENFERFNFSFRFPLILFNALMLIVFFFLLSKLAGQKIAVFSVIFMGLSPILLGISGIVNPDALLWVFMPLSILAYFIYLKEKRSLAYLLLAGVFMGLGLLTKYITNILAVYFLAVIFMEIFILHRKNLADFFADLRLLLIDYFMLIGTAIFTAFLLLPASWKNPSRILEITIWSEAFQKTWPIFFLVVLAIAIETFFLKNRFLYLAARFLSEKKIWILRKTGLLMIFFIGLSLLNTYLGMRWFGFEDIVASPKTSSEFNNLFGFLSANFYSLVFGIAPFILLLIIYASSRNAFSSKLTADKKWVAYLSVFILLYYFASSVSLVSATVRYQIVIFPLAFILASFGAKFIMDDLKLTKKALFGTAIGLFLIASLFSLNSIRPHYFSYASSLLPEQYVLNPKDMGDGSYEAARYLNSLENPEGLRIWTDKRGVCYFFLGRCSNDIEIREELEFDYYVISSGRENRIERLSRTKGARSEFPIDFGQLYFAEKTVFNLEVGGRPNNYVKIISAEDISL